jgi:hypothetical protein
LRIEPRMLVIVIAMPLFSCTAGERTIVLSDERMEIGKEAVVFDCVPPISRRSRDGAVHLSIEGDWTIDPRWRRVRFRSGREVGIYVEAVTIDGRSFFASQLGGVYSDESRAIEARFDPQIPKDARIKRILVRADSRLVVRKVIWHEFNNK